MEYETANPGQDFNDQEAEHFEFDEDNAATGADVARPIPQERINSNPSNQAPQQITGFGDRRPQSGYSNTSPNAATAPGSAGGRPGSGTMRGSEKSHELEYLSKLENGMHPGYGR